MFTRRAAFATASRASAARTPVRHLTEAERAGAAAGVASGLTTGSPMTALIIGAGTVFAYGVFSHFRHGSTA